jgi:probable rRNA maturation factor
VTLAVDVRRDVRTWAPASTQIAAWARLAAGRGAQSRELAVSVVGSRESRRLNARFRGRDRATNVLSFPARTVPGAPRQPLGDLVICPAVLRREARAQGKRLEAHWAHLIVHGTLHLLGHDHAAPGEARRMERREIALLRRLGFPNPYRSA